MMKHSVLAGLIGGIITLAAVLIGREFFGLVAAPLAGLLAGRLVHEIASMQAHDFDRPRFEGARLGLVVGVVFLAGQFMYAVIHQAPGHGDSTSLFMAGVLPLGLCDLTLATTAALWAGRDLTRHRPPAVGGGSRLVESAGKGEEAVPHPPGWGKRHAPVHHRWFSKGSVQPFEWYFRGESTVKVKSVRDICDWLRRCEYVLDHELFFVEDHWQHPITFEQLRKGDCEDHALWAWRKLVELGYHAELVVGMFREYHAWVVFERDGRRFLLESTHKSKKMLFPLDDVHEVYQPEFAVDGQLKTYEYGNSPGMNSTGATRFTDLAAGKHGAIIHGTRMAAK